MSGHSKWHSIKHKKGALDAQRGKIFTKHAKLIALAAKRGPDPDTNPALRAAIDNAKMDNVPNMNVDRAIKKGSGQDKDSVAYEEIFYEAFGPGGTALYIQVITDNKNRALADIKSILTRHGGNMGTTGSAARLFERKGLIIVPLKEGANADDVELALIDAGAQDIKREDGTFEVYVNAGELGKIRDALKAGGIEIEKAEIVFSPVQTVKIEDKGTAEKVLELVNMIDEHDDVSEVYCNFDIDEGLME
jgi:YebC/PmpR family DNA-binding regulatory protein